MINHQLKVNNLNASPSRETHLPEAALAALTVDDENNPGTTPRFTSRL